MFRRLGLIPLYGPYFLAGWGIQLSTGDGSDDPTVTQAFTQSLQHVNPSTFVPLQCNEWSDASNSWVVAPPKPRPTRSNQSVEQDGTPAPALKVVTLNVQKNNNWMIDYVSSTEERWRYQLEHLIPAQNADVICINEADGAFLLLCLDQPWLRREFYISHILAPVFPHRGNLIFLRKSKLHVHILMEEVLRKGRGSVVASVSPLDAPQETILVCSSHLTAYAKYHQHRRQELANLTQGLAMLGGGQSAALHSPVSILVLGDFNFHAEAESASIPNDYKDLWTQLHVSDFPLGHSESDRSISPHRYPNDNGYTFDSNLNKMIPWVYPPEKRRMRLDRMIFKSGQGTSLAATDAFIWANAAIPNASLSYLFPSDHFGLGLVLRYRAWL